MRGEALRVGELARRTGLTIRTLHHYDEIGLVKPSRHGESGYRLYTAEDLARLQQVLALRRLGFSLEEVHHCLDRPDFSPLELIRVHIEQLREQMAREQDLCLRLEAIRDHLQAPETVSAEEILQTIERMTMIEDYYTPEQLEYLKQRQEHVGAERMQQAPKDWETLIAEVHAEKERGTAPDDPRVLELARAGWLCSTSSPEAIRASRNRSAASGRSEETRSSPSTRCNMTPANCLIILDQP